MANSQSKEEVWAGWVRGDRAVGDASTYGATAEPTRRPILSAPSNNL